MTNLVIFFTHTTSSEEVLIQDIKNICLENPQSDVAVHIKNKIDAASIPIHMDKTLMRRLTQPVCNPHDIAFKMPLSMLNKDYKKINNQILIEQE